MHLRSSRARALGGAFIALAFLGVIPGALAAQQGAVVGTVREESSGAPVPSVAIELVGANGAVVASGMSGGDGAFRLQEIAAGTYTLRFISAGWATTTVQNVSVTAGQVTSVSATMTQQSWEMNPIVATVSKTEEKALDAPASVSVVGPEDIRERPATTIVDHVKNEPGVDVIDTGVQSSYVVVRGFNNIFSGATLTMTDNRIARVPSLRTNISHFNPTTSLDLDRVEVVLGPGSALYGPNAANGVIHSITRSPLDDPGMSFSMAGGLRQQGSSPGISSNDKGLFHGEGRIAIAPTEKVGFKVSGQYFKATEYEFLDPKEVEKRGLADACIDTDFQFTAPSCVAFEEGLNLANPADQSIFQQSVRNVARGRDNNLERWSLDGRVDVRPNDDTNVIFSAGHMQSVSSIDLTGIGAGQVVNWGNDYVQGRLHYRDFFAQAFFNRSNNDETYLLRSGRPLSDKSSLFVTQLQNATQVADDHRLIYGADLLITTPKTEGTINGRNEDDDGSTEIGGYAQWEWSVSPKIDLVGAARVDHHSLLENPVFSPRAAVVYKPDLANTFRVTFNRAFSTPNTLNLFLDISQGLVPLPGGLQYDVRATGSTRDGHVFMRDANGRAMHMSPLAPLLGLDKRAFLPTTTEQLWAEAVAGLSALDPARGGLLSLLPVPTEAQVGIIAATLDPRLSTADAPTASCPAPPFCLTPGGVDGVKDISRLKPTISNTFEVGYKGLLGGRVLLGVNGYWNHITDYISALRVSTPNVFLNGQDIAAYLTPQFRALVGVPLPGVGVVFPDQATADAAAAQAGALLGTIPLGVITPESVGGTEPALALVYSNLGSLDVFGAEAMATFIISDVFQLSTNLSIVDKNEFTTEGDNPEVVPLNAPTVKATAEFLYRDEDAGWNGNVRFRAQNGFPANSGVYIGDVDGLAVVDLGAGVRVPGMRDVWFQLDVMNVLDNHYSMFVGTPDLGRMMLARIRWDTNPF